MLEDKYSTAYINYSSTCPILLLCFISVIKQKHHVHVLEVANVH